MTKQIICFSHVKINLFFANINIIQNRKSFIKEENRFNYDYINLFIKTLGIKHALKLEQKLQNFQILPSTSSLIQLIHTDIQPYINQINELIKQIPDLKHLCRLLIRQNLKNVKSSTLESIVSTTKLQDYLLYTPI